jgi:hypothetical protein
VTYRVLALLNRRPLAMLDGYADGDELAPSAWLPEFAVDAETPEGAADVVFAALNDDARPGARVERSLCVGDVVRLSVAPDRDGGTGCHVWLACETLGWREVDEP